MASPERAGTRSKNRFRISYENRIFLLALATGAAPVCVLLLSSLGHYRADGLRWILDSAAILIWVGFALTVRSTVARSLRTLASMQAAVREGDYSIRARSTGVNDSLSEVVYEINQMACALQDERMGALEAGALVRKVLNKIDSAVFAFDDKQRLELVNLAAERLLGEISDRNIGKTAEQLGIADLLEGSEAHTMQRKFPGGDGRWGVRRTPFRSRGVQHNLVVVSDLSRALREEERQAWQRLVRVLGHELNNSLAPIKSLSQSLQTLFHRNPRPADWEDDVSRGLQVIADRSDGLARFMADYSRLARLPRPNLSKAWIAPLLRRVASLDGRLPVAVVEGPDVELLADPDQLEQLFINLLRNAIDASQLAGGGVTLTWEREDRLVRVRIADEGAGIANPTNLFVPFFTTKPGGSGIGLALSRQIAEAHGGHITLANRAGHPGCEAVVELPLVESAPL